MLHSPDALHVAETLHVPSSICVCQQGVEKVLCLGTHFLLGLLLQLAVCFAEYFDVF